MRKIRWWQDCGARMYHRVLGRFVSADPLIVGGKAYAWLSSYQFASANPVWAVDRDGLEGMVIHGTTEHINPGPVVHRFRKEDLDQLMRIAGNTKRYEEFKWYAPLPNFEGHRRKAAEELADRVIEVRTRMLREGAISADEPITLIGYSHGGNVAIQAIRRLHERSPELGHPVKIQLITVATPAFNEEGDVENPADLLASGIISWHLHIVHENDKVVESVGEKFYTYPGVWNVKVPASEVPLKGILPPHRDLITDENFSKWLGKWVEQQERERTVVVPKPIRQKKP